MIHTITPDSKEHWLEMRKQDVTSTEASALFGLSPYLTEFELWHNKRYSLDSAFEETERMRWGSRLEPVIAEGIAEDQGWKVEPFKDYMRDDELKMGSSFDYRIIKEDGKKGILEIKNVDARVFSQGWIVDDIESEAPPHIEIQVQHQLGLTGFDFAYIGALVGGNEVILIRRTPDQKIIEKIKKKVHKFWQSVYDNEPPAPNFEKDAAFIASLYSRAEPGKIIDASEEVKQLASLYKEVAAEEKKIKAKKDEIKANILINIGEAEKVMGDNFSISAGMIGPADVSFTRPGYRNFRVNFRKEKTK